MVPERLLEEPALVSYSAAGEGDGSRERYSQGDPKKAGVWQVCARTAFEVVETRVLCAQLRPLTLGVPSSLTTPLPSP